jgi:hypothetical protein
MRSSFVGLCAALAAVAVAACSSDASTGGCSLEALRPAIIVEVVAASGPALTGTTTGAVHDGDYVDSLRPIPGSIGSIQSLGAAFNRPGTYNVTVVHAGYDTWEKDGVMVAATSCGIAQPVNLVAQLQPAP